MSESLTRRVKTQGVRAASVIDLVAIGFSQSEDSANDAEMVSRNFLGRFQSVGAISDASPEDVRELTGLEGYESLRVQALIELGRRIGTSSKGPIDQITDAGDVYALFDHLRHEKKEHFCVLLLDAKNQVIRKSTVHIGTLNMSIVGPREVFREAIREGASSIIVVHNHPSGDPTPSPEDIEVTKKLKQVGEMLDIPLLDHVVVGERTYVSLHTIGAI
ncbi:MAG: DNA repair protein RadC [Armatimonadetes bacterium]|nr:DNA repair protein RadC [Armatimonadota bacterium]